MSQIWIGFLKIQSIHTLNCYIRIKDVLNILLQIKTFDTLNISYEPLLEAAMRIAGELGLYQTTQKI